MPQRSLRMGLAERLSVHMIALAGELKKRLEVQLVEQVQVLVEEGLKIL